MAYLDHAATTPMLPGALDAFVACARTVGNASSLHAYGRSARRLVEQSREQIAAAVGVRPIEVIFTGGGTESDNLAVKGIYWARRAADSRRDRIVCSEIEHHAVLDAVRWLESHEQVRVTWLPVDGQARIQVEALAAALAEYADEVALVSIMWANNEVGTVQPVAELAALARQYGVPPHSDAVQALGQVPVDMAASGVSALTLSGHKVGGPIGVGALVLSREVECTPLLHGGGQEREVRSGTVDTPAIVAFAAAVSAAVKGQAEFAARIGALRDELVSAVRHVVPDAIYQGDPVNRLPANSHFSFPGCAADDLLLLLDEQGIACSTGSACVAGLAQPSHVVSAMTGSESLARSSLRFTLGHSSTREDVAALIAALPTVVERARRARTAHMH